MLATNGSGKKAHTQLRRKTARRFAAASLLAFTTLVVGAYTPASALILPASQLDGGGGSYSSGTDCPKSSIC